MSRSADARPDVLIFGGGVAGLWTLHELTRGGYSTLLLESHKLGAGQTVCAQGIIHGGLKYTLDGLLSSSAERIREMPLLWRECLTGKREPNLSQTRVRAQFCHLWRTDDWRSWFGMVGAQAGLRITPVKLEREDRPSALRECPGSVFKLDEQVIDPASLVAAFAEQFGPRLIAYDVATATFSAEELPRLAVGGADGVRIEIQPKVIVLAAGAGNDELRGRFGIARNAMQRRRLHMVMMRGAALPELNGHCVDGAKTRVTITTDQDSAGRIVWQVGGQLAEDGVLLSPAQLVAAGRKEIAATIPGLDLRDVEWSTYRVDRAEATADGRRPNDVSILVERQVITAWPTKLALAPRLAEEIHRRVAAMIEPTGQDAPMLEALAGCSRPIVAPPPWEERQTWIAAR